MTRTTRYAVGLLALAAMGGAGFGLLHSGVYGLTLFVMAPIFLGALGGWVTHPRTAGWAAAYGAFTVALASLSLLMIGLEGMICIAMALPLGMPLGALGGWAAHFLEHGRRANRRGVVMLLLFPQATFLWDTHARPTIFEVHSAITIAAPPEKVWKYVVSFDDLPEPREWFFRTGIAYPKRARIAGSGPGAIRYCEFSTGAFVEPIEVWEEPLLLRFRVTQSPPPMEEWSPWARVRPKHLHGYFLSRRGQFQLTRLPQNRTLLKGTTWYQHGLWPSGYWQWWSEAIIHRIHLRVLNHIRALAEAP